MTAWGLLVASAMAGGGHGMLPVRVETGVGVREGAAPSFATRVGAQVVRTERWAVDVSAGWLAPRALYLIGPQRNFMVLDGLGEATFSFNGLFAAGPSAGFAYRLWYQQGRLIDDSGSPVVGLRLDAALVRARTWGLRVVGRGLVDLDRTNLVLEDNSVHQLNAVEAQLTFRVDLGHGRVDGMTP